MQRSRLAALRHSAFVLFVLGIPFFALAFADPRATVVRAETTQPGQRIAIVIDGSGSMVLPFEAPRLRPAMDRTFYTAVAAAERFVSLRMNGNHSDIIGVIEFGSEAFVVTPFTTDYENVILSLNLIGEPRAWNRFNVFGTTIIQGIAQGLQLFSTFDVLRASGNMMVIFSDGNDGETTFRGRTLEEMMAEARDRRIPIHMVRLGFDKRLGDVIWDPLWKPMVERSGGRFYPAFDEETILRAISEIDRLSTGRIAVRHYATAAPAFPGYAVVAVALWLTAGVLKLTVPYFRTFP
jgi:Ca-activated chloride channel family protein